MSRVLITSVARILIHRYWSLKTDIGGRLTARKMFREAMSRRRLIGAGFYEDEME